MADSDEPLSFEKHRRKRDDNPSLVPCARCGKRILATMTKCPECGVHFQGEAEEFAHESEKEREAGGTPAWMLVLAVLLLLALFIGIVGIR